MSIKILVGDCRDSLKNLPDNSVQSCITSPPYYALRKYPGDPSIWGGDSTHAHQWGAEMHRTKGGKNGQTGMGDSRARLLAGQDDAQTLQQGQFCECGAWKGQLGLEPYPDLYIAHLLECLEEVKRVLKPDGTLWLNIGDSYSGSHGNGYKQTMHKVNYTTGEDENIDLGREIDRDDGCKPKDLLMIPAQVAIALRNTGWYLRSQIPWVKRNCMPESVKDRPTSAVEYVFLLSKSNTYFYDPDAVRSQLSPNGTRTHVRAQNGGGSQESMGGHDYTREGLGVMESNPAGRNRRNSDWFIESWQGLLLSEDDDPLALVVNPNGFKDAHYATFAPKFVEPMIKAGTSEKGQCPECGAPWTRVIERGQSAYARLKDDGGTWQDMHEAAAKEGKNLKGGGWSVGGTRKPNGVIAQLDAGPSNTVGWQASCAHTDLAPVSQTVIDCFGGAGTVGLVADRLGRDAILCELSDNYSLMSDNRLVNDAPMFAEVSREVKGEAIVDPKTGELYETLPLF